VTAESKITRLAEMTVETIRGGARSEVQIIFSAGRQFYAVPEIRRECGLWLSVEKHPLPVPPEWRRPESICACVMCGRDYYRVGVFRPLHSDGSETAGSDDERVRDYRDAAWWTPGLEEAWVELQELKGAFAEATEVHVFEQSSADVTAETVPDRHTERSGGTRSDSRKGGNHG
jgi:hypothetical protein